jgi:class 3 adenylate cyclase
VEKIKTIGDAYMVAAGIPEAQSDHADRIAALAPRMLERGSRSAHEPQRHILLRARRD